MQTILVLIFVLVLGYTGAHLLFYQSRFPLGTRYILFAGSEYLFFGLILGLPQVAVLTPEIMGLLSPAVNLGLGWIGLLFGIQFEWIQLRRIPLRFLGITIIQAAVTLFLAWIGLSLLAGAIPSLSGASVLLLATVAALSSPTCLAFVQANSKLPQSLTKLVHYISSLDAVVSLFVFGLVRFLYLDFHGSRYLLNLPSYIILGTCLIVFFHLLTRFYVTSQEMMILTIGIVVFSSGLAGVFGISALLLNFIVGVGIINLPSHNHRKLENILHRQEKPIYIIFLVLAGAMWTPTSTSLLVLTAYLVLRLLGKVAGSELATSIYRLDFKPRHFWGLSLMPHGGMGIALVVDFLQYHHGEVGLSVLNIILAATFITQFFGPLAVRFSLKEEAQA